MNILYLLLPFVTCNSHYWQGLDLSFKLAGSAGPMSTGTIRAGGSDCTIDSTAAINYTPGSTYTINVVGGSERVIHASKGTFLGNNYGAKTSFSWTSSAGGEEVTFSANCAAGYSGPMYSATQQTISAYVPPAKCSSKTSDVATFCANNGANGLIAAASTTECDANPCTISADAVKCCQAAAPSKCNTITNTATFCANNGNNGLIDNAASTSCDTNPCTNADKAVCCKPAANAALCSSITNPSTFCTNHGNNGLIDNPASESCGTPVCTASADGSTCCKVASDATCNTITDVTSFCRNNGNSGLIDAAVSTSCKTPTCTITNDATTCCQRAKCDSITDSTTFCVDNGNNGLIDAASTTPCQATCTIANDGSTCCKSSVNAAMCNTITDVTTFCQNNGANGLIDASGTTTCAVATCTMTPDASKCCKEAAPVVPDNGDTGNNGDGTNTKTPAPAAATVVGGGVSIALDSSMTAIVTKDISDPLSLKFEVTYQGVGWFGIGVSSDGTMDSNGQGSDLIVCEQNNVVKRYWSKDKSKPTNGIVVQGATCVTSSGKSTMTFSRTVQAATGSAQQRTINSNGATHFIHASHTTSKTLIYHSKRGSLLVENLETKLIAAANSNSNSPTKTIGGGDALEVPVPFVLMAHGILMALSWGLLLPLGVLVAMCNRHENWWFRIHKNMQYLGWFLQIVGVVMAFVYKNDGSHFVGRPIAVYHMFGGLLVVIIGTLQPLNACCRPHDNKKDSTRGTMCNDTRVLWEFFHKNLGRLAILFGVLNCFLGGYVISEKSSSFSLVIYLLCGFFFMVLIGYSCKKTICQNDRFVETKTKSKGSSSLQQNPMQNNGRGGSVAVALEMSSVPTELELPYGWVSKMSESQGKRYYISPDGVTQWEFPKIEHTTVDLASENEQEQDLPPGWISKMSESQGKRYYVSPDGVTQWNMP